MAKKEKAKKPDKVEEPEAEKPAEGEEGAGPARKKMAGKTLVLFIILPALLVVGGGGAAAFMLLGGKKPVEVAESEAGAVDAHGEKKPPAKKKKEEKKKDDHGAAGGEAAGGEGGEAEFGQALPCEEGDPCYYAMPKMIVNLTAAEGESAPMLDLELTLESSDAANFEEMHTLMPRLKDQVQTFLRELRVEDLNGSAGSYRLRGELLKRFNLVLAPARADAVLIESQLIMQQ